MSDKIKLVLNIGKRYDDEITNDWSISRIVTERVPNSWENVFKDAELELKDIDEILTEEKRVYGQYYPNNKDLFKIFEKCPLQRVKVVILGQDPYYKLSPSGNPQAMGMSFSVSTDTPIPPSLSNIYKELKRSVNGFVVPRHGCLDSWAQQGVFLLNTCLTVRPGNPGSHKEIWLGFIKKVINAIINSNPNTIFVFWGRKAEKMKKMVGERVTIIETSHPSPLSVYRGFRGCDHFNEINKLLVESKMSTINWNL